MEELHLRLVGPKDGAFLQYVPGNFRELLGQDGTVCVGAVYGRSACGAAKAPAGINSFKNAKRQPAFANCLCSLWNVS